MMGVVLNLHSRLVPDDPQIRPEYDATVGQAARFQRDYNGQQPGDPARAAQVILKVVRMDDPPIRLLLGSDALKIVQTADARADRKWSALRPPRTISEFAVRGRAAG